MLIKANANSDATGEKTTHDIEPLVALNMRFIPGYRAGGGLVGVDG